MPFIFPGNVASATAGAYDIDNSCRFNSGDSAYMTKALGTPSSQKQFTFSAWIKRGVSDANMSYFSAGSNGDSVYTSYRFESTNIMRANVYSAGGDTLQTDQLFRDAAAWYHVVITVDTPNAVEADRIRFYVNGTRLTGPWGEEGYPAQDDDIASLASGEAIEIGRRINDSTMYFDGYMADVVFIDGQALTPSSFGEFDSDSPTIWKPKDPSGLTFGNNGFYLDFKDSANLGNDANGGTDLTEVNLDATDQFTDTPTNNFCVMNPVFYRGYSAGIGAGTMKQGNLEIAGLYNQGVPGTMFVNKGKWYFENKPVGGVSSGAQMGIVSLSAVNSGDLEHQSYNLTSWGGDKGYGYEYRGYYMTPTSTTSENPWGDAYANGSIIYCAFDCDNNRIYWAEDGVWGNSQNPVDGTNAISITAGLYWTPQAGGWAGGDCSQVNMNFGAGCSYAISSGNADDNGYGNFEYDVPAGYYALCTKNLAEFG